MSEGAELSGATQKFGITAELGLVGEELAAAGLDLIALKQGDTLFAQGSWGDSMYILAAGILEVAVKLPDGSQRVLSTLEPPAIVGEMSLLLGEPRSATIVAKTEAALWKVDAAGFGTASLRGDAWASRFLLSVAQVLARRLAAMNGELVNLIASTTAAPHAIEVRELEAIATKIYQQ